MKSRKPGVLSDELTIALNIPQGAPCPWLITMQRYGPPPSYPQLKIQGLNAPIPQGAQWGYHPGGWGKPPVDENNKPLYGDVFGVYRRPKPNAFTKPVEHELWGQPGEAPEEEEEESEEEESDGEPEGSLSGFETASSVGSVAPYKSSPPRNARSVPARSSVQAAVPAHPVQEAPKELYKVLPQANSEIKGLMGSSHKYKLDGKPDGQPEEPIALPKPDTKPKEKKKQQEFKF